MPETYPPESGQLAFNHILDEIPVGLGDKHSWYSDIVAALPSAIHQD
jgi:hypothetical protein